MRIVHKKRERKAGATLSTSMKCFMALREMVDKYKFKPYPGTMLFVRAIENEAKYLRNSHFGWKRYAKQVKVYDLPGNHNTLFSDKKNAKAIASILQEHFKK
jgi:thioesterase domain-containing protein